MRKSKQKKINKTKKKKREEFQYKCLITFLIIGVIYYYFFESQYIGDDYKYDLYVFWLPVLFGLILIVKFNLLAIEWNDILPTIRNEKNIFYKIIYLPFLVLMHFMLSVMFFWIPSNIIWDIFNKIESNKNQIETYTLNVVEFNQSSGKGSSNRIRFVFKEEKESIKTSFKDIEPYLEKNPDNFQVIIEVKKGIWNHYILESWYVEEVSND